MSSGCDVNYVIRLYPPQPSPKGEGVDSRLSHDFDAILNDCFVQIAMDKFHLTTDNLLISQEIH